MHQGSAGAILSSPPSTNDGGAATFCRCGGPERIQTRTLAVRPGLAVAERSSTPVRVEAVCEPSVALADAIGFDRPRVKHHLEGLA